MRVSTVVLALACLVAGYAMASTRVSAVEDQARRFPGGIAVGTRVSLTYMEADAPRFYANCTIAVVDGGWFRCAVKEDPFNKPPEVWMDLAHVTRIEKVSAER